MRNLRSNSRGVHPHVIALGILILVIGLLVVVVGAIAVLLTPLALFTIGVGWWLMISGAVVAIVGYFI
jgi:hypothetical protein